MIRGVFAVASLNVLTINSAAVVCWGGAGVTDRQTDIHTSAGIDPALDHSGSGEASLCSDAVCCVNKN